MSRIFLLAVVATAWALTANATLAVNFAFAVPGEPGITLRFNGYDAKGRQIFGALSSTPEPFGGAQQYVVRVDGQVLANGALAKWCVTDAFLNWAPTKALNTKVLCDESPSETGGTYTFDAAELRSTPTAEETLSPQVDNEGFSAAGVDLWWGGADPMASWTHVCREDDSSSCLVRRDIINDDGSIGASLVLRSQPDTEEYVVQVRLPSGGLINTPTKWQVDGNDIQEVPFKYCFAQWCVSEALAAEDGISSFRSGNVLKVSSLDISNKLDTRLFGLDGFTSAFNGPATMQPSSGMQEIAFAHESHGLRKACQAQTCVFVTSIRSQRSGELNGRFLLRLSEGQKPLIAIGLPQGMDLQRGIIVHYAGNSASPQGYHTCDVSYCVSWLLPSDQLLARILLTDELKVRGLDLEGKELSVTFDLSGLKEMTESDE